MQEILDRATAPARRRGLQTTSLQVSTEAPKVKLSRPVNVWTWRRALRDHGPIGKDAKILLTLLMLATWMNSRGEAYPSQSLIAKACRCSVRSVRRHVARAKQLGWLQISTRKGEGRGWRHSVYQAAVPRILELDSADEILYDHRLMEFGNAPDVGGEDKDLASPSHLNGIHEDTGDLRRGQLTREVRKPSVEAKDIGLTAEVVTNSPISSHGIEGAHQRSTSHPHPDEISVNANRNILIEQRFKQLATKDRDRVWRESFSMLSMSWRQFLQACDQLVGEGKI